MLLLNVPVPVPLFVFVPSATVGFVFVLQHTPLAVTGDPPSEEMLPPDKAVVGAIDVTGLVVRTGGFIVVKGISFPYPVPAPFVA